MDTILITGANGFVGSHLINSLSKEYNIIALDIAFSKTTNNSTIEYIKADITELDLLEKIFQNKKIDKIIHLSALLNKDETSSSINNLNKVNILGTANIAYLANKYNIYTIFFSTGMVYGKQKAPFKEHYDLLPINYYGFTKKVGEKFFRYYANINKNFIYTIFRPSIIYGPNQKGNMFIPSLIEAYKQNKEFNMTKGKQLRDFIYINDVVNAVIHAIKNNLKGEFNLSYGNSVPLRDIADYMTKKYNMKINLGAIPYRENEIWEYSLSNTKLKNTGWKPKINIFDGLDLCINYQGEQNV